MYSRMPRTKIRRTIGSRLGSARIDRSAAIGPTLSWRSSVRVAQIQNPPSVSVAVTGPAIREVMDRADEEPLAGREQQVDPVRHRGRGHVSGEPVARHAREIVVEVAGNDRRHTSRLRRY